MSRIGAMWEGYDKATGDVLPDFIYESEVRQTPKYRDPQRSGGRIMELSKIIANGTEEEKSAALSEYQSIQKQYAEKHDKTNPATGLKEPKPLGETDTFKDVRSAVFYAIDGEKAAGDSRHHLLPEVLRGKNFAYERSVFYDKLVTVWKHINSQSNSDIYARSFGSGGKKEWLKRAGIGDGTDIEEAAAKRLDAQNNLKSGNSEISNMIKFYAQNPDLFYSILSENPVVGEYIKPGYGADEVQSKALQEHIDAEAKGTNLYRQRHDENFWRSIGEAVGYGTSLLGVANFPNLVGRGSLALGAKVAGKGLGGKQLKRTLLKTGGKKGVRSKERALTGKTANEAASSRIGKFFTPGGIVGYGGTAAGVTGANIYHNITRATDNPESGKEEADWGGLLGSLAVSAPSLAKLGVSGGKRAWNYGREKLGLDKSEGKTKVQTGWFPWSKQDLTSLAETVKSGDAQTENMLHLLGRIEKETDPTKRQRLIDSIPATFDAETLRHINHLFTVKDKEAGKRFTEFLDRANISLSETVKDDIGNVARKVPGFGKDFKVGEINTGLKALREKQRSAIGYDKFFDEHNNMFVIGNTASSLRKEIINKNPVGTPFKKRLNEIVTGLETVKKDANGKVIRGPGGNAIVDAEGNEVAGVTIRELHDTLAEIRDFSRTPDPLIAKAKEIIGDKMADELGDVNYAKLQKMDRGYSSVAGDFKYTVNDVPGHPDNVDLSDINKITRAVTDPFHGEENIRNIRRILRREIKSRGNIKGGDVNKLVERNFNGIMRSIAAEIMPKMTKDGGVAPRFKAFYKQLDKEAQGHVLAEFLNNRNVSSKRGESIYNLLKEPDNKFLLDAFSESEKADLKRLSNMSEDSYNNTKREWDSTRSHPLNVALRKIREKVGARAHTIANNYLAIQRRQVGFAWVGLYHMTTLVNSVGQHMSAKGIKVMFENHKKINNEILASRGHEAVMQEMNKEASRLGDAKPFKDIEKFNMIGLYRRVIKGQHIEPAEQELFSRYLDKIVGDHIKGTESLASKLGVGKGRGPGISPWATEHALKGVEAVDEAVIQPNYNPQEAEDN